MNSLKIPKILHYCWFGNNKKPDLIVKCIESWEKYCPDYEIIEWNETNFDVNSNTYVKEAYEAKKWAFVTDYVRLYVLSKYGGIYVDSDVEFFKNLDCFLECQAFTGFESKDSPITAIMGCIKSYQLFNDLLAYYDNRHFILENGTADTKTNTETISNIFCEKGIKPNGKKQEILGCVIYPEIIFCPCTFGMVFKKYSKKTYTSHHFMGSWGMNSSKTNRTFFERLRMYAVHKIRNIVGTKRLLKMRRRK